MCQRIWSVTSKKSNSWIGDAYLGLWTFCFKKWLHLTTLHFGILLGSINFEPLSNVGTAELKTYFALIYVAQTFSRLKFIAGLGCVNLAPFCVSLYLNGIQAEFGMTFKGSVVSVISRLTFSTKMAARGQVSLTQVVKNVKCFWFLTLIFYFNHCSNLTEHFFSSRHLRWKC